MECRLEVESPTELAARYYPNGRLGGLSVPGKSPGALGQYVQLIVTVARPARAFEIRGQLAWARHKAGPGKPAGFGVDFIPEDDATRVRLLAFARQELELSATRAEHRQQVALQVRLVHAGAQRREQVADLSTGGAFVRTWNPLPVGSPVQLFLRPPLAFSAFEVKGHVVWVRAAGDHAGMGLEFEHDESQRVRLEKLLIKLAR